VVIRTGDVVLVVSKEQTQKIKELVDLLARGESEDLL